MRAMLGNIDQRIIQVERPLSDLKTIKKQLANLKGEQLLLEEEEEKEGIVEEKTKKPETTEQVRAARPQKREESLFRGALGRIKDKFNEL